MRRKKEEGIGLIRILFDSICFSNEDGCSESETGLFVDRSNIQDRPEEEQRGCGRDGKKENRCVDEEVKFFAHLFAF